MHLAGADMEIFQDTRSLCNVDIGRNFFKLADARHEESGSFLGDLLLVGECKGKKRCYELQDIRARGLLSNENVQKIHDAVFEMHGLSLCALWDARQHWQLAQGETAHL